MKKLLTILLIIISFQSYGQYYIRTQHGSQTWMVNANGSDSSLLPTTDITGIMYKPQVISTIRDSSKLQTTMSIGTTLATSPLTVTNFNTTFPAPQAGTMAHFVSSAVTNGRISSDTYNTSFTGSNYQGRSGGGTAANPTAAVADKILVALGADGYGSTGFHNVSVGSINIRSEGTMTDASAPTYIAFTTTPTGSITQVERMRIKSTGVVNIAGLNAVGFVQTDANGNLSTTALTNSNIVAALGYTPANAAGTTAWGSITGTLSSQTDLQTALNAKQATITNGSITNVQLANGAVANLSGTNTGDNAVNSLYSGLVSNATHTGEVTGSTALTITANAVTNAKAAQMAANTFKANNTGSTANATDITVTQAKTLLAIANTDVSGLGTLATQSGTFSGTSSGTNTGDNATNSLYSGLVSNANHTGDATGSTALTLATVNSNVGSFGSATQSGTFTVNAKGLVTAASSTTIAIPESAVTNLTTDLGLKANLASPTFTGTVSGVTATMVGLGNVTNESKATMFTAPTFTGAAILGTPASGTLTNCTFPTLNQNTSGSAATLTTPRAINGTNFDGSAAITVTAAAGTLTGSTLNSSVTASSLTSVGTLASGAIPTTLLTGTVTNSQLANGAVANLSGTNTGDQTTVSGNAGTATTLQTARNINGTSFNGSANINITGSGEDASIVASSTAINTTETVLVQTPALAANRLVAGTVIRVTLIGTCTSTGANVSTFAIRIGTAGTTSDGLMQSAATSTAALTGANIPFRVVFEITIRTAGASATSHGSCNLWNNGITGISTATTGNQIIVPSFTNFSTTTANNIISATYKSAASTTTCTFTNAFLEFVYK